MKPARVSFAKQNPLSHFDNDNSSSADEELQAEISARHVRSETKSPLTPLDESDASSPAALPAATTTTSSRLVPSAAPRRWSGAERAAVGRLMAEVSAEGLVGFEDWPPIT